MNREDSFGLRESLGTGKGSLLRSSVASAVATACDFMLAYALAHALGALPAVSVVAGCALGAVINFTINRLWVFESRGSVPMTALRYGLVSSGSAFLNAAGVSALLYLPDLPYSAAWWLTRGLIYIGFNYPLQRDFVFHHTPED